MIDDGPAHIDPLPTASPPTPAARPSPTEFSHYNDLTAACRHAWALISRGVGDRRSAFHTPTVATVGRDGAPDARTVVLRGASPDTWMLRFHTDRRSRKFGDLAENAAIAMHFYDAGAKIQVRCAGLALLHTMDAVADAAWQRSQATSRVCYQQHVPPGLAITDPMVIGTGGHEMATGRDNFAVVEVAIGRMEWLYLAAGGHRRAVFSRADDGAVGQQWIAP